MSIVHIALQLALVFLSGIQVQCCSVNTKFWIKECLWNLFIGAVFCNSFTHFYFLLLHAVFLFPHVRTHLKFFLFLRPIRNCVEEIPVLFLDSCKPVYLPTGSCSLKLWKHCIHQEVLLNSSRKCVLCAMHVSLSLSIIRPEEREPDMLSVQWFASKQLLNRRQSLPASHPCLGDSVLIIVCKVQHACGLDVT